MLFHVSAKIYIFFRKKVLHSYTCCCIPIKNVSLSYEGYTFLDVH